MEFVRCYIDLKYPAFFAVLLAAYWRYSSMKTFNREEFESAFYSLLWREDTLDCPILDRKFLYNGSVLRVKMIDSIIVLIVCIGNGKVLYNGEG